MWDNTNKWVFLHTKKCAGSSVEIILRQYFGDTVEEPNGSQHWNLEKITPHLTHSVNDYFIFSSARNPWDRFVSMYYHAIRHDKYTNSFDQYIKIRGHYCDEGQLPLKYHLDNENIDYVIRFESLEEDVKYVMNKLGIREYVLPHYNHETERPKTTYRDLYTKETKDLIAKYFRWDIEVYGYKF